MENKNLYIAKKLNSYIKSCFKSDSTGASQFAMLLVDTTIKTKNVSAIITKLEAMPNIPNMFRLGNNDDVVRWSGRAMQEVLRALGKRYAPAYIGDMGMPYHMFPKGEDQARTEALEKRCKEICESWMPFLEWNHIGNHREKGWRDIEGRNPITGKRIVLVEVKGRDGRCTYNLKEAGEK
jgi:hypothetical protein